MILLQSFFAVDYVLIEIHGYGLSAIELFSTVLGLWSYIEIIRRKKRGLAIGALASLLLACLFYQLHLYSDMGLMHYYAIASIAALVVWRRYAAENFEIKIVRLSHRMRLKLSVSLPLAIGLLAFVSSHLHIWLPSLFPESARFSLGDAATTVFGITASILLIQRKAESMALWLAADTLSTFIYLRSGVYFLAAVYCAYMLVDLGGFIIWLRRSRLAATSTLATPDQRCQTGR